MANDPEQQAALEELKEKAFKKLKEELRDNVEAREFLQRLALSEYQPLEDKNFAGKVGELEAIFWEEMIAAGDDYIPIIGHPDLQVCNYIVKSMLARLRIEGRPVPRLLERLSKDLLVGPEVIEEEMIDVDPETEDSLEHSQEKTRIKDKTLCVFMLVRIGIRCEAAIEGGLTATRNDGSIKYSVCDAVREVLDEIGHELSFFGVARCWREGKREFPDLA